VGCRGRNCDHGGRVPRGPPREPGSEAPRGTLCAYWPLMMSIAGHDFQPLIAKQLVLLFLKPPLPPDVSIPLVDISTMAQRRAFLNMAVFGLAGSVPPDHLVSLRPRRQHKRMMQVNQAKPSQVKSSSVRVLQSFLRLCCSNCCPVSIKCKQIASPTHCYQHKQLEQQKQRARANQPLSPPTHSSIGSILLLTPPPR